MYQVEQAFYVTQDRMMFLPILRGVSATIAKRKVESLKRVGAKARIQPLN